MVPTSSVKGNPSLQKRSGSRRRAVLRLPSVGGSGDPGLPSGCLVFVDDSVLGGLVQRADRFCERSLSSLLVSGRLSHALDVRLQGRERGLVARAPLHGSPQVFLRGSLVRHGLRTGNYTLRTLLNPRFGRLLHHELLLRLVEAEIDLLRVEVPDGRTRTLIEALIARKKRCRKPASRPSNHVHLGEKR